VTLGRPSADGKSIVGILTLGVEKGHVLRVVTEGTDEDRAVETLRDLLASRPEKAGQ
jgi:phosphocarrier protein HPr/phosphocarrier protein